MSGSPFSPFLERQGFVVLDGGLATALEERGHDLSSKLWSARLLIDAPDEVRAVHRAYLEAGADCIATVSYQASYEGFAELGLGETEVDELLERSVRLALEARDDFRASGSAGADRLRPIVAASLGPYGAYLADGSEYDGRYGIGPVQLTDFHRRRFEVLADSEADVIACETIPSGLEAEALLGILADVRGAWAWLSFSCREGGRLHDGTSFRDAARMCAASERVAAVGVNCTPPHLVAELLAGAGSLGVPLMAYPNSGESYDPVSKTWSADADTGGWLEGVDEWVAAGARIVGGCCRTGPETVEGIRSRLRSTGALG